LANSALLTDIALSGDGALLADIALSGDGSLLTATLLTDIALHGARSCSLNAQRTLGADSLNG
jgi:hypothetical protein